MTDEEWKKLKYFKITENWGDPYKMDYQLLLALEKFRSMLNKPITINYGTQGSHVSGSYHYKGMAVDLHVKGMELFDVFMIAIRIPEFGGIGLYPEWNNPGLHLDIRQVDKKVMWVKQANIYIYNLNKKSMKNIT
jgi:hypothetical protein